MRRNVIANYAGQAYITLIGVIMLPFYLEFLGAEAYGLVGFFALLHAWLSLLTAGLSPTLARQVAHYRGTGELGGSGFRAVLRSIEILVLALASVTVLLVSLSSSWLATEWLGAGTLSSSDVAYCIALMGVIVAMRWGVALYSSGLGGMERQVWLNGFNVVFATLRFVAAYVLLRWVSNDPTHYFEFQLVVSMLELAAVALRFYRYQPQGAEDPGCTFSWPALRELLPFTLGVAYTSMLWVLITQSDKLILSHVLTLAEYGYFALVVLIANGVLQFSSPVNQAVLPRLTFLLSQGREAEMIALYRKATQFIAVAVAAIAGMLALFPQQTLFVLSGNQEASQWGAPLLAWFALGNGILVIAGMQFVLQYAYGQMRMHVVNTTINAVVQVPILAYLALNYGPMEVAVAWFVIRLASFLIWPALIHRRFVPGLHLKWLRRDVLAPVAGAVIGLILAYGFMELSRSWVDSRLETALLLVLAGGGVLLAGASCASEVRAMLRRGWR